MSAHSASPLPGALALQDSLQQLNAANLELAKHAVDMQQKLKELRLDHADNCVEYDNSHKTYLKLHTIIRACEQETAKLRVANAVLKENHNGVKSKVAQLEAEVSRFPWISVKRVLLNRPSSHMCTLATFLDHTSVPQLLITCYKLAVGTQDHRSHHSRK
jgi:chromosome segregation ATPase